MKIGLHVLRILLFGLLVVTMIGCSSDDEDITPEEKLAGEYELIHGEYDDHVDDEWDEVRNPPEYQLTIRLNHGADAVIFGSDEGDKFSEHFDSWSATDTTITFQGGSDDEELISSYTLQGTTLTIIIEDDDGTLTLKLNKEK